jgi:hypothetical protein
LLLALALVLMLAACGRETSLPDGGAATPRFNSDEGNATLVEGTATRLTAALRQSAYWHTDPQAVQAGERGQCSPIHQADAELRTRRLTPDQSYIAEAARFLDEMCGIYETNLARFTDAAGQLTSAASERRLVTPPALHGHTPADASAPVEPVEMSAWEAESWLAQGSHRDACARLALYRRATSGESANLSFAAYCSLLCQ